MRGLLAGGRGAKDNASPQASEAAGTGARLSPRCAQPAIVAAASEATGARARLSSRRAQPARRRPTLSASIPDRVEDEQGGRSLLLPALALGLLVGLVGAAFRLALELATQARHALVASAAAAGLPGAAVSALVSAAGVGLAVWLVRRVAPETAGSGIQEIEGALDGVRPLRWRRVIPVKFAGGLGAIGSGMIAGREGPTVQMGGALGRMLG
ncbi:MAG TPA: chloride channel protein, partial [Myxococcota bacterium]|nr:chloride channel protein [Myxococcota bacterium]